MTSGSESSSTSNSKCSSLIGTSVSRSVRNTAWGTGTCSHPAQPNSRYAGRAAGTVVTAPSRSTRTPVSPRSSSQRRARLPVAAAAVAQASALTISRADHGHARPLVDRRCRCADRRCAARARPNPTSRPPTAARRPSRRSGRGAADHDADAPVAIRRGPADALHVAAAVDAVVGRAGGLQAVAGLLDRPAFDVAGRIEAAGRVVVERAVGLDTQLLARVRGPRVPRPGSRRGRPRRDRGGSPSCRGDRWRTRRPPRATRRSVSSSADPGTPGARMSKENTVPMHVLDDPRASLASFEPRLVERTLQ